jgi:N-acetylglucosaminyldiphosphoundecaprenol N-acetyl-beta-D-mannosaminyltransferase
MSSSITMMGCRIDRLSMEETLGRIEECIRSGKPHQHVVVNVDKLVKASRDEELRRIINACALVNADGMPVVWASRLLGNPLTERVAGIDLFEALMRRSSERGWREFLLGARPALDAARRLEWFYRFLQEPRRMFRRYFIEDMAFFRLLIRKAAHMRRH